MGESWILSLFDYSGEWARPYAERGYSVLTVDLKKPPYLYPNREHLCADVASLSLDLRPRGILLAPPCTHFASSGARWFAAKDSDGRTANDVALVRSALALVNQLNPTFWALENPVGRLRSLVPELGAPSFAYDPYEFGGYSDGEPESYSKRTLLWGNFSAPTPKPVPLVGYREGQPNRWYSKVGGSGGERAKAFRSKTPRGFALAFAAANP